MSSTIDFARQTAKSHGISLLEGDAFDLQGVRFIGATLWSDYSLADAADSTMLTGEDIRFYDGMNESLFRVRDAPLLHRSSRERLRHLIHQESRGPRVVVTHHPPLPDCIAPADSGKWIAGNCASDCSELTDCGRVELWVHGHVHHGIDMRRPGGTRIICNPAGALFSNSAFDENLVVVVES